MHLDATPRAPAAPGGGALPRSRGRRPGFSLAELLVVAVVVGILAVLIVPNIEVVKFRMDGTARGVMTALMSAQRAAVKRQHDVVVAFDTAFGRLRIHEDGDRDGLLETGERVRYVSLDEVRFGRGSAPARAGVSEPISFTETQGGLPAVRFLRSGSASEEGVFYLTSSRSINGLFAKDTRAIQVERATGRATWFYYDAAGWKKGY